MKSVEKQEYIQLIIKVCVRYMSSRFLTAFGMTLGINVPASMVNTPPLSP
jgi:hypothetical protein